MTTSIVTTKMGQAEHMGKWESHIAMIRLVRELQDHLEENGIIATGSVSHTAIDNVVYEFLSTLPQKCSDEVREG